MSDVAKQSERLRSCANLGTASWISFRLCEGDQRRDCASPKKRDDSAEIKTYDQRVPDVRSSGDGKEDD